MVVACAIARPLELVLVVAKAALVECMYVGAVPANEHTPRLAASWHSRPKCCAPFALEPSP